MRLRLSAVDEYQFLTCIKYGLWGSKTARFNKWQIGDYLAVIVNKSLAGLAEVIGKPFVSRKKVWDNGLYPNRIPLKFLNILQPNNRPPVLGKIRDVLTSEWGPHYGWGILNQQLIEGENARIIIEAINSRDNQSDKIRENLDQYLQEARSLREMEIRQIKGKSKAKKKLIKDEKKYEEDEKLSKQAMTIHTKAQLSLIELGRSVGCSIWVAVNDQKRVFKGSKLARGCLKSLPNLGLSTEATKRISLIDIIWIKQNAPVCAFEVESTTSIYSGLLRMSDLLSVVPALNMKLYIVAPAVRRNKVLNEITRPTFQKIGASEFCKFIAIEDLESLLIKVMGMEGHIQPSIIDTISIEPEEELRTDFI